MSRFPPERAAPSRPGHSQTEQTMMHLHDKVRLLEDKWRHTKADCDSLRLQNEEYSRRIMDITSTDKLQLAMSRLLQEKAVLSEKVSLLTSTKDLLSDTLSEAQSREEENKREMELLNDKCKDYKLQVDELQTTVRDELQQLRQEHESKCSAFESLSAEFGKVSERSRAQGEELNILQLANDDFSAENKRLSEETARQLSELKSMHGKVALLSVNVEELKLEKQSAVKLVTKKQLRIVKELKTQLTAELGKNSQLKAELKRMKHELDELRQWRQHYLLLKKQQEISRGHSHSQLQQTRESERRRSSRPVHSHSHKSHSHSHSHSQSVSRLHSHAHSSRSPRHLLTQRSATGSHVSLAGSLEEDEKVNAAEGGFPSVVVDTGTGMGAPLEDEMEHLSHVLGPTVASSLVSDEADTRSALGCDDPTCDHYVDGGAEMRKDMIVEDSDAIKSAAILLLKPVASAVHESVDATELTDVLSHLALPGPFPKLHSTESMENTYGGIASPRVRTPPCTPAGRSSADLRTTESMRSDRMSVTSDGSGHSSQYSHSSLSLPRLSCSRTPTALTPRKRPPRKIPPRIKPPSVPATATGGVSMVTVTMARTSPPGVGGAVAARRRHHSVKKLTQEHDEVIEALSDKLACVKSQLREVQTMNDSKADKINLLRKQLDKKQEFISDLLEKLNEKPPPPPGEPPEGGSKKDVSKSRRRRKQYTHSYASSSDSALRELDVAQLRQQSSLSRSVHFSAGDGRMADELDLLDESLSSDSDVSLGDTIC